MKDKDKTTKEKIRKRTVLEIHKEKRIKPRKTRLNKTKKNKKDKNDEGPKTQGKTQSWTESPRN